MHCASQIKYTDIMIFTNIPILIPCHAYYCTVAGSVITFDNIYPPHFAQFVLECPDKLNKYLKGDTSEPSITGIFVGASVLFCHGSILSFILAVMFCPH